MMFILTRILKKKSFKYNLIKNQTAFKAKKQYKYKINVMQLTLFLFSNNLQPIFYADDFLNLLY